ncbi:hypothetical protein Patl1_02390 [Pistacia atlantica]|uniref:Uncharacterized protein n=1 Tax=Pistacia atlantica TaxID=434234 RepID=A0ACC1C9X5_9ROSI|nr:hypothetical protein Patl1_02390 [Pistacia atlantica]
MVSDGIQAVEKPTFIQLNSLISSHTCDQTYGFLPCTTTVFGNVFLILVYGYLMFLAAKFLSDGSEILLQILGPGIIGGLFLPVLSSVPDAAVILASGLSGSKDTAQSQVSVGMGLMAGSIVMLLTILWGSCLLAGKCDIEGSRVSTEIWTSYAARIMIISAIPFIIVQLPQYFLTAASSSRLVILISLIVSISLVLSYCLYQVFQPLIQKRRIAYLRHKHVTSGILKHLRSDTLGRFFTDDDGRLSAKELRALIVGIQFEEIDMNINDAVEQVLKDMDKSEDSFIHVHEFVAGISRWLIKAKHSAKRRDGTPMKPTILNDFDQQARKEYDLLGDENDEVVESIGNPKWKASKAVLMLLMGAVCSDPLVDAVDNFSTASSVPSFFISFIILPFVTSSEVVSTLTFASRKRLRTASLTYSEIYGSVTMSNILSLSVFLGPVYFRQLTWNFSASISNSTCLLCNGPHCQLSHHLPSLVVFGGLCALSTLSAVRVCS